MHSTLFQVQVGFLDGNGEFLQVSADRLDERLNPGLGCSLPKASQLCSLALSSGFISQTVRTVTVLSLLRAVMRIH